MYILSRLIGNVDKTVHAFQMYRIVAVESIVTMDTLMKTTIVEGQFVF